MTTSWKIAIVLALILSVGSAFVSLQKPDVLGGNTLGALGVKLIENYSPYVKYNGGTYTALPIQTTSTLSAGATTISGITTLTKSTFCINFYATSTATVLHMVASTTATLPNGAAAVITANYGSCS